MEWSRSKSCLLKRQNAFKDVLVRSLIEPVKRIGHRRAYLQVWPLAQVGNSKRLAAILSNHCTLVKFQKGAKVLSRFTPAQNFVQTASDGRLTQIQPL